MIHKQVLMGKAPATALQEFDKDTRQKIQDMYGPNSLMDIHLK